MESRIPSVRREDIQSSCTYTHDSTVNDAFSSLMDSGDSPCSLEQRSLVESSAESVLKRPGCTPTTARRATESNVKWAVNDFFDGA